MTTYINQEVYIIVLNDTPMNCYYIFPEHTSGGAMCFASERLAEKERQWCIRELKHRCYHRARIEKATLSWEKYEDD